MSATMRRTLLFNAARLRITTPVNTSLKSRPLFRITVRYSSTGSSDECFKINPDSITIFDKSYPSDTWTNAPPQILSALPRKLHLQPSHPIGILRTIVESRFPPSTYARHNTLPAIVSTAQNFDSLGFPMDHPGRSKTDTYYVNEKTVLRTHTSAHQADMFREEEKPGFLISADVYRRDAIDRSHYPVFHQMEGARVWDRKAYASSEELVEAITEDIKNIPRATFSVTVEDPNPPHHPERNPLQQTHSAPEAEAVAAHLKRTLEGVVAEVFGRARQAKIEAGLLTPSTTEEPLKIRWIEAYFPFTSPSWELEVWWDGQWLELLGCGVVQHPVLSSASSACESKLGWAFGLGLERIAMVLFGIPDIRLFWTRDARFLEQFGEGRVCWFKAYSKYPPCYKDVAFWLPQATEPAAGVSAAGGGLGASVFHENDLMEIVRGIGGDLVEDVQLIDEFTHPKTKKSSKCYRINYRSMDRSLTNEEVDEIQEKVRQALEKEMKVTLR
ncbi:phenylalanyl-tRNA synthetase alpha subunit, mitochondrial [Saitoella coloradoensis]